MAFLVVFFLVFTSLTLSRDCSDPLEDQRQKARRASFGVALCFSHAVQLGGGMSAIAVF